MAINLPSSISITSKNPIDVRILLSKAEMLDINEARMPEKYFALCKDDGKIYTYDEANEVDADTGKFRLYTDAEIKADLKLINEKLDETIKSINNLDPISKSGSIEDIKQPSESTLILNCNTENYKLKYGDKYYTSIQDIIDNNTEMSLEIIDDVILDAPLTIAEGKTVELNVNNHLITNAVGQQTIVNKGKLTISGTGVLDNTSHQKAVIYNDVGGDVTLSGCTLKRSAEAGTEESAHGNSYYTIKNYGTMTINDGTIVECNGSFSSAVTNGWYSYGSKKEPTPIEGTQAKLIINGGKFFGGLNAIKNDDNGYLEINNGHFENDAGAVIFNVNTAKILNGTFKGSGKDNSVLYSRHYDTDVNAGVLEVLNGYFEAGNVMANVPDSKSKITISGGTFNKSVEEFVKDGYKEQKVDDKYIVVAEES